MKKAAKLLSVMMVIVMILALFCGCGDDDLNKNNLPDEGTTVEDGLLVVRLDSNVTTGYTWDYAEEGDMCLEEESTDYVTVDNSENGVMITGAPGVSVFSFKPANDGTETLRFKYARSWEQNSYVSEYVVTVNVEENNIEIVSADYVEDEKSSEDTEGEASEENNDIFSNE